MSAGWDELPKNCQSKLAKGALQRARGLLARYRLARNLIAPGPPRPSTSPRACDSERYADIYLNFPDRQQWLADTFASMTFTEYQGFLDYCIEEIIFASTFALSDITSVEFQYGTSPGEGSITVDGCTSGSDCSNTVPEPGSLALLGAALGGLGLILRRRIRHRTA